MIKQVTLVLVFFMLVGCSGGQDKAQTTPSPAENTRVGATNSSSQAADLQLVFFLNPNGEPCQMQDSILATMAPELEGRVTIRYVSTTIAADQNLFNGYGVRALPTLLLADGTGKEIRRLSPGVQDAEAVRRLLTTIPKG